MTKSYGEIFNEAKRKVNANIKNTESKKIPYEAILKQANTKREVTHGDVNKINNFFVSARQYIDSFKNDTENLKWNNVSNVYAKNDDAFNTLRKQAEEIKVNFRYLNVPKTEKDQILADIDNFLEGGKAGTAALKEMADAFSQFETEEEYNQALEFVNLTSEDTKTYYNKQRENVARFEKILDIYKRSDYENYAIDPLREKPIAGPQGLIKALKGAGINVNDLQIENGDVDAFNLKVQQKLDAMKGEISKYDGMMQAIEFESKTQNFKKMLISDGTQAAWEKNNKKDYAEELSYNNQMSANERTTYNLLAYKAGQTLSKDSYIGLYMVDSEYTRIYRKQIKEGMTFTEMAAELGITTEDYKNKVKDAANFVEYEEELKQAITQRQGVNIAGALENKWLLQEAFGLWAGVENWASGIGTLVTGKTTKSVTDYVSAIVKEDLKSDYGVWGSTWGGLYDVNTSVGQMLPAIAMAYATKGASLGLGANAQAAAKVADVTFKTAFGASAYGSAYGEMIDAGYTKSQAKTYAILSASSEILLQDLLGGIGKFTGKITNVSIEAAIKNIDNAFLKIATTGFIEGMGELSEEALQEVISPIFKSLVTGDIEPINWGEVIYAGAMGFFTSAAMNGVPLKVGAQGIKTAYDFAKNNFKFTNKGIKNLSVSENLYSFANTMPENTTSYKLAQVVKNKGNAYNMLSELAYLKKPITEEMSQNFHDRLVEDGYSFEVADMIKNASVKVSKGINIPQYQKTAIEANVTLSPALLDAVVHEEAKALGIEDAYNDMTTLRNNNNLIRQRMIEKAQAEGIDESTLDLPKIKKDKVDAVGNKPISDIVLNSGKNNSFTPEQTAENVKRFEAICKNVGFKVIVKDRVVAENGKNVPAKINKSTKTIEISRNAEQPIEWLFKHELTHSTELKKGYSDFAESIAKTEVYRQWLKKKTGLNKSTAAMERAYALAIHSLYAEGGFSLNSDIEAMYEVVGNFIADMLFNDADGISRMLEELNKQERSKFLQFLDKIFTYLKNVFAKGDKKLLNEIELLERQFVDLMKGEVKEETSGKVQQALSEDIVDLSKDNELSKRIGNLTGAPKYKVIKQYIKEVLGNQPIIMSDGKKAVVDNSDANHLSSEAWDKKTAEISEIKRLIETAKLYAEDKNTTHNKFDYFCYYKADVKYDNEVFSIYLNVGRAINDKKFHIYDITNKIRDTADRINGLERPKPNEGYALSNGISKNKIPQKEQIVNDSALNSLSKFDEQYSYAGEKAKTANIKNLQRALDMEKSGKFTGEEIRRATGWFRSYDKKWRFEIDDSKMQVKDVIFKDSGMTLADIIDHKELFDAYPQLRNIKIGFLPKSSSEKQNGAEYDPINKKIILNRLLINEQGKLNTKNEKNFKPILIHEIQHAIQDIEGFATGASPGYWKAYKEEFLPSENTTYIFWGKEYNSLLDKVSKYNKRGEAEFIKYYKLKMSINFPEKTSENKEQKIKELSDCVKKIKKLGLEEEFNQISLIIDKIIGLVKEADKRQKRSPGNLYEHTAGEIEANDVMDRLEYDEQDRYIISPDIDTPDVVFAEKDDIIRLLKNGETVHDNLQNIVGDASKNSERNYSYKELISKPDMKIKTVSNVSPEEFKRYKEDTGLFAKDMRKIAADVGNEKNTSTTTYLYCRDLDADVQITKESFKHGAERIDGAYIAVCKCIADVLENSVVVNELKARENTNGSYVLLGLVQNADDYIIVRSVINKKTWKLEEYNELYAIRKKSIKKEDVGLKPPHYTQKSGFGTSSIISISNFLKIVNGQNLGNGVLSENVVKNLNTSRAFDKKITLDLQYSLPEIGEVLKRKIEQLQADNKHLVNLVNLKNCDDGYEIKEATVDGVARKIMRVNNVKGDKAELTYKLMSFYKYIANGENLSTEMLIKKAEPTIKWLQNNTRKQYDVDEYSRGVLKTLRKSKIYLDEMQKQEVEEIFKEWDEEKERFKSGYTIFRNKLMGSIVIANQDNAKSSLDQLWQELSSLYPSVFDAEVAPNDMPGRLLEIVQMLREGEFNIETQETDYFAEAEKSDLFNQIYEGFWEISSKIMVSSEFVQKEISKAVEKVVIKHNEEIEKLNEKHAKEMQKKIEEKRHDYSISRKKTETRAKIKKAVNTLNSYLLNGTKEKHVPEWMQASVVEVLDAINMDTVGAQERIDKLREELNKNLSEEKRAEIEKKIAHIHDMGENLSGRLAKVKAAYTAILDSADPTMQEAFDEVVEAKIQQTIDSVGNTSIRKMTLDQLEEVYDMFNMVLTRVRNVNKAFDEAIKEKITEMGNSVVSEIKRAGGENVKKRSTIMNLKSFEWEMLKPIYAMKAIGSNTFTKLFKNILNGQNVWARDMEEAKTFISDQKDKYGFSKWNFNQTYTFSSRTDSKFKLNLEQIMSLYAYSKRTQAKDHLLLGGITFAKDVTVKEKNKFGIPVKYEVSDAKPYNISPETLGKIISKLSNQQKEYVDAMQDYLSTVMGTKGNDVSMKMYGIKLFKEKNYFPLKSKDYFLKYEAGENQEKRIKNSAYTKKTQPHAKNPIVLDDFSKVWAKHVNDMSLYHSFVLPLEDFNRVFNYSTLATENTEVVSVKSALAAAYGQGAEKYVTQMLSDLNGGARTDSSGIVNKLISLTKKNAVMLSASVIIQQPSSVVRAMAYINPKYFANHPFVGIAKHKLNWELIKKYAPVAVIKEMGRFDTGMGVGSTEWLNMDNPKGVLKKASALITDEKYRDDALGKFPGYADEMGWIQIWKAVEKETQATRKFKSKTEEFYKACGERFSEVIELTQVYDSTLSRSGLMRKSDAGMKMITAFMAEPTTQLNMIIDCVTEAKRLGKGEKGKLKIVSKTAGAVIASVLFNSLLKSFVMAARDDDANETYLEKYVSSFYSEFADNISPLGWMPIVKDVFSIFSGYDVERLDMSMFSDFKNAVMGIFNEDKEAYDKWSDVIGATSTFFGIPIKNIIREGEAVVNLFATLGRNDKTTWTSLGAELKETAIKDNKLGVEILKLLPFLNDDDFDITKNKKLYDAVMSGNETYIERVKKTYKDEKAVNTALRKGLRAYEPRIYDAAVALDEGNTAEYEEIINELVAEGNFSQENILKAIRSEFDSWNTDDDTKTENAETADSEKNGTQNNQVALYRKSDMNRFLNKGDFDSAQKVIANISVVEKSKYIAKGFEAQEALKKAQASLKSSITSFWKNHYVLAYDNKDDTEMLRIRKVLSASGLYGTPEEVRKKALYWATHNN